MTVTSDPKSDELPQTPEGGATAPVVGAGAADTTARAATDKREAEPHAAANSDGEGDDEPEEDSDGDNDDEPEEGDHSDPRRAAFLDELPDAPVLRPLIESYVAGNYARLRKQELVLRDQTEDPEILAAGRELVERTEPDPLSKALLWLSVGFFLFIVGWVYFHHGQS